MVLPESERRVLLILLDLMALYTALVIALGLRPGQQIQFDLIVDRPDWILILVAIWFPVAFTFDAYDMRVVRRFSTVAQVMVRAGLLTALVYALIPLLTPTLPTRRVILVSYPLLTLALLLIGRGLYVLLFTQPIFRQNTLILGAGAAGRDVARVMAKDAGGMYRLLGFIDDDPQKLAEVIIERGDEEGSGAEEGESRRSEEASKLATVDSDDSALRVLGDRHALPELVEQHQVSTLVLAITKEMDKGLLDIIMECRERDVEIVPMAVLYEQLTGQVPVEHVGKNWYIAYLMNIPGTGGLNRTVKRILDILLASIGLLVLLPLLPFIALAITLDSRGPVFFSQERVGKGGRVFRAYKFRTMVPEAEKDGAVWAQENDARITRVGRFLRRTHIDEFPQFINILRGDMSVVGPRPERPEFVDELEKEIPLYNLRHVVRPGMAGWGLVRQGYGSSKEDALLKLQHDLYYIKNYSLGLDFVVLLKTFIDTVSFGGR